MDIKKMLDETIAKVRKFKEEQKMRVMVLETERKAQNVDDTSQEKPPTGEGPNWDDYWKHWTGEKFEGAACACCGASLTTANRVGAHIRLQGDADNTKDAWIALYCSSCNNWQVRVSRKVRKGAKIVRVKMANPHKNAIPKVNAE